MQHPCMLFTSDKSIAACHKEVKKSWLRTSVSYRYMDGTAGVNGVIVHAIAPLIRMNVPALKPRFDEFQDQLRLLHATNDVIESWVSGFSWCHRPGKMQK